MIKAKGRRDGRETVILGLSFTNLDRLRQDQPIVIKAEEIGIAHDIVIFAGPTEQAMADRVIPLLTADAKVHISDRLKE